MLLDKYNPKNFDEFIGNKVKISKFFNWIKDFPKGNFSCCLLSGNHGIGKSTLVDITIKELSLDKIEYQQSDLKQYKNDKIDLFFPKKTNFETNFLGENNKKLMIFNEIENITIPSEKNFIIKLLKKNHKEKILPIILINNGKHSKIINDIKSSIFVCSLSIPSIIEIKPLIKKICQNEKINIDSKYYKGIIKFCNNDIRKIILTLQDFKDLYKNKLIDKEKLKNYYSNNNQKQEEIGLYHSVENLLNYNLTNEKILILYQLEKILLPLTFLENIPLKNPSLESYSEMLDSFSTGDIIETSIYTDQNWYLQDLHAFKTCIYPNYILEKNENNLVELENIKFTNDLNKTSLKNINKKNIEEIKNLKGDISFDEIINLASLITKLINNKKDDLLKNLGLSKRLIELLVKINKFEYESTKMSKKKISTLF